MQEAWVLIKLHSIRNISLSCCPFFFHNHCWVSLSYLRGPFFVDSFSKLLSLLTVSSFFLCSLLVILSPSQNVALELITSSDLKLVDRPAPVTLAPGDARRITTAIKVSGFDS